MSNGLFVFGAANTSGRLNQSDAMLNHLSTCQKANLQCVSLVASQDFSCQTGVIGNLTVSGNLIVKGDKKISGDLTVDGVLQVCDIQCPADLSITAGGDIITTTLGNIFTTAEFNITTTSNLGDINSTATGDINSTATGGINSTATGDITQNSSNHTIETSGPTGISLVNTATGSVILNLTDGDLSIAKNSHLQFFGPSGNVTVTGLGSWAAATILLIGGTDTTGIINFSGLPAAGITVGDGFRITFDRSYSTDALQGFISANRRSDLVTATAGQQAGAAIALSGYHTQSDNAFLEVKFIRNVAAADIATFNNNTPYTNEMTFAYFIVDSISGGP